MLQEGKAVTRRKQRATGQRQLLLFGLLKIDHPFLARRFESSLTLQFRGNGRAIEITHEKAVARAVLGFPRAQVPPDISRPAVLIEELHPNTLHRSPTVTDFGKLIAHDAPNVGHVAPRRAMTKRQKVRGPMRGELSSTYRRRP